MIYNAYIFIGDINETLALHLEAANIDIDDWDVIIAIELETINKDDFSFIEGSAIELVCNNYDLASMLNGNCDNGKWFKVVADIGYGLKNYIIGIKYH